MTLDQALVDALEKDYTSAPISEQDRVMLDYVIKVTKDATKVGKDCEPLASTIAGFCRLLSLRPGSTTSTGWRMHWGWDASSWRPDPGIALLLCDG